MDYSVDGWFYIGGTAQALWSTFQSQPRGRANCVIDSGGTISFGEQDADGGNSVTITSSSSFPLNQWVFVRCAKFGTAMNLYVNGTLVATGTSPVRTNFADHIHIGTFDPTSSAYYYWLNGYIDDFRVTVGSARDTGSSAAPTAAAPNVEMFPFVAQDKKTRIYATKTCASSFAPDGSHGMTLVAPMIDHLGNQGAFGTITGTVKVSDTPSNDPVHRRVRLYRDRDGVMVAETWSDATTGAYTFNEVDSAFKYTVIAYDYEHNYRAVAADNITAVTA
jgi:hypothetical protein